MSITLSALQKQRRDTAANWTAADPTLLAGELGYESDTGKWKIGDGSTAWTSLGYEPWSELSAYPIVNADIASNAEIAVSKLADGTARQLLQTDAAGTGVEWASNIDVPGTLDVSGVATFDSKVTINADLEVTGTTTTIDTQNLIVEDKNIEIGKVGTPTDVTADGGGITLKGSTDKTINWVDATDAWTFSEHVDLASTKEYRINGTKVLDATSLGSAVVSSSLTSVGTIGTGIWQGTTVATGYGGTGIAGSYTDGQLLIGKTDGTLAKATLTASTGVTITNGNGTITISATGTGGTVTAVSASSPLASTGGTTPDISIQDGTTAQKGAVQLEDSTSSTSTTKAATPNSVKSAYDLANAALPKAGGTMTGDITFNGTQTFPGTLVSGDIGVTVQGYDADTAKLDVAQTFTAAQTFAADATLNGQADLRFADSDSSNWVAFQAPATVAANVTWTLPAADGTTGQALTTDGSGVLSWATAGGGSGFAAGTAMLFVQTSAPTGWTKSTTHNDKTLRVVSGSASSGGSTAFSTVFASRTPSGTVGSTTLTTSQIPSHTHTFTRYTTAGSNGPGATGATASTVTTDATGGGSSHDHSFTGTAMDFAVQYVDVIIATKD